MSRLTPALPETAQIVAEGPDHEAVVVRIVALDEARTYPIPEAARATGINEASLRSACWQG